MIRSQCITLQSLYTRLTLLLVAGLLHSGVLARPNVVVIMADDLAVRSFNNLLQEGWLPNIENNLVKSGVEFSNAFVTNSDCCPSRVTFLRGQYSHNHRVFSNHSPDPRFGGIKWPGWFPKNGNPGRNESTLATWLMSAGYHTGLVGKYLNGYGSVAPDGVLDPKTYIPPGWSEWYAPVGITTYRMFNYIMNENGVLVSYGQAESDYQTDVYSDLAVDFIQRAVQTAEPFFLFISPLAPHLEVLDAVGFLGGNDPALWSTLTVRPAPRHEYLIDNDPSNGEMTPLPQLPSFNELDLTDKPSCPQPTPPVEIVLITEPVCVAESQLFSEDIDIPNIEHQNKTMKTAMLALDDLVGAVFDELSNAEVLDDTVIIFVSDNGWIHGEHRLIGKSLAYEESIRVPLLIRAPGGATDVKAEQIVLNNDLAPTIAELTNLTVPYEMDGTSLVPILNDPGNAIWTRRMFLYEHFFIPSVFKFEKATQFALRRKTVGVDFSYIATHADTANPASASHHEFYNLLTDPYQLQSFTLPESSTDLVDKLLLQFLVCRGAVCQTFEAR